MIRYTLRCDREHEFEAWFRSSGDYDRAAKAGGNVCPVCGSAEIEKALMTPAVAGARKSSTVSLAVPDPRRAILRDAMREFRKKVTEGEGELVDEARQLAEEEIAFQPLPSLPEEQN